MKRIIFNTLWICLVLSSIGFAQSQDSLSKLNSDELYALGRTKVFDGKRNEGRKLLFMALSKSPDYSEIQLLIARSYAWDDKSDSARYHIQQILAKEPNYLDALITSIDIENWAERYPEALQNANKALKIYPTDSVLILKKARVLSNLNKNDEAAQTIESYAQTRGFTEEMKDFYKTLQAKKIRNIITLNYALDVFNDVYDPAHNSNIQYTRVSPWGSLVFRENFSQRFDTSGFQTEVDAYPTLFKKTYAYLNYGFSNRALFPRHRIGVEIYRNLPKAFEVSAGLRFLDFESINVNIYTISIGKYYRSYWLSVRTFLTPDKVLGLSNSYNLLLRRYFKDANNFLELNSGIGFSPDYRLGFQGNAGLGNENIVTLKANRIGLGYQRSFGIHWQANVNYTYRQQQFAFNSDQYIGISSYTASLLYLF
jgi:YaiO family outer membrane protein